jgi:uncharacterized protein (UPF0276 family)
MGGGTPLRYPDATRCGYLRAFHGVGVSLGSAAGLDERHLARLRQLAQRVEPDWISEHLSWSAAGATHFAALVPLPPTEMALSLVCRNIELAQAFRAGRSSWKMHPRIFATGIRPFPDRNSSARSRRERAAASSAI